MPQVNVHIGNVQKLKRQGCVKAINVKSMDFSLDNILRTNMIKICLTNMSFFHSVYYIGKILRFVAE